MTSAFAGLLVASVSKHLGDHTAVKEVTLSVPLGTVLAIIGPSGAGKTTLLRCIAGLDRPDSGRVVFRDPGRQLLIDSHGPSHPVWEAGAIGLVFQGPNLWPHMTVLANLTYALVKVRGLDVKSAEASAMKVLAWVGLEEKARRYPDSLSGGEEQRAAIARTLVMEPALILLDEITSALDVKRTHEVLEVVQQLAAEGRTMVIVTHELGFARRVASQIALIDDGKLVEVGTSEKLFVSPASEKTKKFLSYAL